MNFERFHLRLVAFLFKKLMGSWDVERENNSHFEWGE